MPLPFDHRNLRPRGPTGKGGSDRQQEGGEGMALLRRGVDVGSVTVPPKIEVPETEETKKMATIKRNTSVMSFTDEECCPTCLDGERAFVAEGQRDGCETLCRKARMLSFCREA